jgi:hypothetical protein
VIKSRKMRWAGHVARMEERRGVYRFLVGKPKGRRPLVRPMSTVLHKEVVGLVDVYTLKHV